VSETTAPLARTPLYERHRAAGAKLVPFAGFEMPVVYSSILDEHRAVRTRAGLFDVSHMGELRVRGRDALAFSQQVFCNDVAGTGIGRVRYGLFCLESGGAVDDVTLYRTGDSEVLFCVNASNIAADREHLLAARAAGRFACEISDESEATALLALQGPLALEIVAKLLPAGAKPPGRWRFANTRLASLPVLLSRTGYTGEDGYEIYCEASRAVALWDLLVETGGARLTLAGLGARDTLRTEMAYPLYGHELDRDHDPIEAGLGRFVAFGKSFTGEAALRRQRDGGARRRLVGLTVEGRQVPRPGHRIVTPLGDGVVTSGTFGPSVDRSIALGYVPAGLSQGAKLAVEIRGKPLPCDVVPTPFYRAATRGDS
jgi:aminomethyltransferase